MIARDRIPGVLIAVAALWFFSQPPLIAEELVRLATRPGVTVNFILIKPENPVAAVILFPGGGGVMQLTGTPRGPVIRKLQRNFLVRNRQRFAAHGLVVAVPDAPTDRQDSDGMFYGFRDSAGHREDVGALIGYLGEQTGLPVWLVGTSRGTESAAQAAMAFGATIRGLVLTSPMSKPSHKGTELPDMALERVRVPVLIAIHGDDACPFTPPEGAGTIRAALSRAPVVELKTYTGGARPESDPCRARSPHGFWGLDVEVVGDIARFIRSHSPVDAGD